MALEGSRGRGLKGYTGKRVNNEKEAGAPPKLWRGRMGFAPSKGWQGTHGKTERDQTSESSVVRRGGGCGREGGKKVTCLERVGGRPPRMGAM